MVTKRFLRLALLGLLAFTVFCLVVLELSLRDKNLVGLYRRISHLKANVTFINTVPSMSRTLPSISRTLPSISRTLPSVARTLPSDVRLKTSDVHRDIPSGSDGRGNLSQSATWSSLNVSRISTGNETHEYQVTTVLYKPSSALLTSPTPIDHCQGARQESAEKGVFSFQAQLLPDGSRPVNCSGCFHSRFPPLLQNCSVCNTGSTGGGGREKQEDVVEVLMVILTTHKAVDRRQAIRDTWASVTRNNTASVRHVFMLGRSTDENAMKLVQEEHKRHGDIIMYDYMDTYANLTLKTLTAMHWAVDFCNNTRYILKADDDMWMNIPSLLTTLKRENTTIHTAIGGACHMSAGPIRNKGSKWYASFKAYPQNSYPGFCSGTSYVTSLNVARHVVSVSPDVPFFYLEDVYMALCMKKLGPPFRLHGLGGFFFGYSNPCTLRSKGVITVHEVSPQKLREIWGAKCP